MSCHDLTETTTKTKLNFRSLLGLGLNFCPKPRFTTSNIRQNLQRFQRNLYNQYLFHTEISKEAVDDEPFDRRYHLPSDHTIPNSQVSVDIRSRFGLFNKSLTTLFKKRRARPNLIRHQRKILRYLTQQEDFIICSSDKNLGPCIIERRKYVERAFSDHLGNNANYELLTEREAVAKLIIIQRRVDKLLINQGTSFTRQESNFISHYLRGDPSKLFPHFYLTMKVHKEKLGSRPIISLSGTALYGLGVWTNNQLQPLIKSIDSFVLSSKTLVVDILDQSPFGTSATLFTCDAVGMYNNINTEHALHVISDFMETHILCKGLNWEPIYEALEIIMTCNVFQFSDYYFIQKTGTAMGTPPAPPYAILYFAIKELELIRFNNRISYYKRYIDDVLAVWLTDTDAEQDEIEWQSFQDCMNDWGDLKWTFSERSKKAVFLDLELSMDNEGAVTTQLYEKAMNLYLYLPPHSAHPPGVLKGLIFGTIHRVFSLTSDHKNRMTTLQRLYCRLIRRGHHHAAIKPLFDEGIERQSNPPEKKTGTDISDALILHLPYHPDDPPSRSIQRAFKQCILEPPNSIPLSKFPAKSRYPMRTDRLIIAYHKNKSLKNLLSPRRFDKTSGPNASAYL